MPAAANRECERLPKCSAPRQHWMPRRDSPYRTVGLGARFDTYHTRRDARASFLEKLSLAAVASASATGANMIAARARVCRWICKVLPTSAERSTMEARSTSTSHFNRIGVSSLWSEGQRLCAAGQGHRECKGGKNHFHSVILPCVSMPQGTVCRYGTQVERLHR
jgi:hypothetical protein